MRAGYLAILALNAASAVVASPAPVPEATTDAGAPEATEGLDQIAELAAAALENAQDILESDAQKRDSTCNWSNIRIRREW